MPFGLQKLMEYSSQILEKAVEQIASLPGIGRKTALRLALHLLRQPKDQVYGLSRSLTELVDGIKKCKHCHNLSDTDVCQVCADPMRDKSIVCVVEDIRDVIAIETTGLFHGVYHVLGGKVSPMDGISPSDIEIASLIERCTREPIKELIFALSATIEGDTTAYYIYKQLPSSSIKLSSIARGVAVGGELQYTDEITLARSIENRVPYETTLKGS